MIDPYVVGSALYNKVKQSGTIATYYQKAPQSATTPYTLVYFMTANDDYVFGNSDGLSADYVIKVVSSQDRQSHPEQALALYSSVHSSIQDANFTIPSYNVIKIRRESIITYEDQSHFWNVGGLYNLQIWKQ